MTRVAPRWRTPFGAFVARYGAAALARDLGRGLYGRPISVVAVYQWVGGRSMPRPAHAQRIVALSRGTLTLADVFSVREALAGKAAAKDRATRAIVPAHDSRPGGKS